MSADRHTISPVFLDLRSGRAVPMPTPAQPLVACLGNFDGVHTAHASLLRRGLALRDEHFRDGLCGVFTFFRPSSDGLGSHLHDLRHPQHLTTLKEKLRLFAACGMDFACLCEFKRVRALSPREFLHFLDTSLGVRGAVCGFNFHFGAEGRGTATQLKSFYDRPEAGYYCSVAPPYLMDGNAVSSTRIRKLLLDGQADVAAKHLGHPYALVAKVVKGKQLGRKLGFPTANQYFLPESLVPAHGVYAVLCHTPLGIFPGVANIGSHPTVDEHAAVNCETYVIGPAQDLYGHRLRVEFLYRLRGEERFDSVEALTHAIERDTIAAQAYIKAYTELNAPKKH